MSNRNNRVVVKSLTQERKRSCRRRRKAVRVLLSAGANFEFLHPAIAALFREDYVASREIKL